MENIKYVKDVLLKDKSLREDVTFQIKDKMRKIENILIEQDFSDIFTYAEHSPINLLEKIEIMISRGHVKYVKAKVSLLKIIRKTFEDQIDETDNKPVGDRQRIQKKLANILQHFIPKELEFKLRERLEEFEATLNRKIQTLNEQFEEAMNLKDDFDLEEIEKIGTFFDIMKKENLNDSVEKLKRVIKQRLITISSQLKTSLSNEKDMSSGLKLLKKISMCFKHINPCKQEIETIFTNMRNEVIQVLTSNCKELLNIQTATSASQIEKAFISVNEFLTFSRTQSATNDKDEDVSKKDIPQLENSLKVVCEFLLKNSVSFTQALTSKNIAQIKETLSISSTWKKLCDLIKQSDYTVNKIEKYSNIL